MERNEIYIEYLKNLREYRSRVYDQLDELNKNTSWKEYTYYRDFLTTRLATIESNEHRVMRDLQLAIMIESENTKVSALGGKVIVECNK